VFQKTAIMSFFGENFSKIFSPRNDQMVFFGTPYWVNPKVRTHFSIDTFLQEKNEV
jgi:hypothetical protein